MTRRYVAPALSLPQVSDASAVRKWMEKVNNLLTVREGMLGDSLDQNVTFRDLFEAGLTKEYINGVYQAWGGGNNLGTIPATADGPSNYDIPPTPTGLVAAAGIGLNILQWTNPATLYGNHAYTEVWRSATNNLGAAVRIGSTDFYLYSDSIGTTNSIYYYWIRFVSKANKYSAYNAGATSGVAGTTAYVVASNIFVTNLSAINADMGSITAGTITGGTIQTAASGARIVLNASNLIGYNSASVAKTTLSGSTGLLTAVDANITGTITATVGAIGGWTIAANSLISGSGATTVGLDSGGTNPALYAGSATPGIAPFRVTGAGKLTATDANINGRVSASSFATSGSYLSVAASAADTTLNVYDTTDFASSGSGQIVDATNDRDAFSWTGKTATTLTGCSGVLAHPINASVISLATGAKSILINDETNEMRFYGDRGGGTIEELASIGIKADGADYFIADFGSANSSRVGVRGSSNSGIGVFGVSTSNSGVYASSGTSNAVYAGSDTGVAIVGVSNTDVGVNAKTNGTTHGAFKIDPKSNTTDPTAGARGEFYVRSDGVLRFHDGTSWKTVTVV